MHPQHGIPKDVATLARVFIPHYTVFFSFLSLPISHIRPRARDLYQLDGASQLTLVQKAWMRDSVLPPIENITGIVGTYVKIGERNEHLGQEQKALYLLRHELYEKYHFGGPKQTPFVCPRNNCDIEFKNAAEWRAHITLSKYRDHDRWVGIGTDNPPFYTSKLPAEIEDNLIAKELEIDEAMKHLSRENIQLEESWGEEGSEQRRLYEEQFLTQLKDDPLCKCQDDPQGSVIFTILRGKSDELDGTGDYDSSDAI